MKLGIGISEDLPIAVQQRVATHVEGAGFVSLWCNEAAGRDALLLCQAWAAATTDLEVGVGVAPVWTRSPAQLGMASATLQEASGGRFLLGLGVSHPATMGPWHGADVVKPVTAAREMLQILRELDTAGSADVRGEVMASHGLRLAITPRPQPTRRYLGAMGPRMLALAGSHADGALLNWAGAEEVARARARVHDGVRRSGRDPGDVEVAAYVRVAVAPDRTTARAALAGEIGRYCALPAYADHLSRQGFGAAVERAKSAHRAGADTEGLAEALGDDTLDALGWAGSIDDDAAAAFDAYRQAGLDHLVARVVVTGNDAFESVTQVVRSLDHLTPA